ncbi:oxidoreductase, short chain dehydrogenase/reductase family [Metarhizium robertsii ARSEF 23]|uniref:Oxidoreductase, short chain dehydrogenase/reductase family n=1 Tax=Metarhizium robertsii (strain ARSEF 23 / ATCC MYA-3075) TaxID=655844 RepID=E9F945_METRA|nr:oxidoreductase, short chain dehydrogenase/reductase family [Metarhizium robertsii ARSEF 23]EFY95813.2 oxidoreductase, short chain dehydrogenase/reductase family [Metarhizium robertsii ARSEF 23]
MAQRPFAIIAGVGAGTGAAVARRFAKQYPVALLARSSKFASELVSQIEADGGIAASFQANVSDEESMNLAFDAIKEKFGTKCAAAIFNASSRPFPKPFLWQSQDDLAYGLDISLGSTEFVPTLIFTGATASVKANAWMQPFTVSKHALRALSQTLSREFEPQGVHVAHVIIDGVIRMPLTRLLKLFSAWDAKLDPDAIAESYWHLHAQSTYSMTSEIAIRPFCETW